MGTSGNPNTALLRAMDAVSMSGSPENWEQLYKELLDCRFVIPIREVPEDMRASVHVEEGYVPVSILQARDNSGKLVTLAFTGIDALRDWNSDVQYVEVPSRQFFQTIKTTDIAAIIINLHRPDQKNIRMGGRITRFEFSALAEGMIPGRPDPSGLVNMNVPEAMDVYIADPESPPSSRILDSAVAAATSLPEVQQLYLFQMTVPGGEPHNVIGIDVAEQPRPSRAEEIMRTMAQSVNVLLGKGEYLDLLLLGGPLGEAVRSRGKKLL
jgi:type III secretion system (T3SS) SseB-like protein